MNESLTYKWLDGREATHVPGFRYRLSCWQPAIKGSLVPCRNAYHGANEAQLSRWASRNLFVIESKDEWFGGGDKLFTRGPVRIVEHLKRWDKRTALLCAADFAETVLSIFECEHPDEAAVVLVRPGGGEGAVVAAGGRAAQDGRPIEGRERQRPWRKQQGLSRIESGSCESQRPLRLGDRDPTFPRGALRDLSRGVGPPLSPRRLSGVGLPDVWEAARADHKAQ